ncbi:MAG: SAM-dependent methyltransferase, partial [Chloroflexia bacterium]|nr:SAM-dependent methyltransferase [Chloroflexia bacterium]
MDDVLRSKLHDLALDARRLLTDETRSVLTAIYGLSPEGRFEPVARLPAVQSMLEVEKTRKRLERYIRDEAAAGRKGAEAVERLVRETAFTHLNRLVAFKLLEARKLIRGTLDKYHASNGFLFYLADHPEDEARYQAGDMPQDALGEGPREVAYRHFLLWQAGQLAREVAVLFDATNLPSRLFPRPRAIRELIEMLNAPELREAWDTGNEETLGWVYQYFNSQELEQAFRDARLSGKKFEREDIPAVTQLFTPRWIVRFLVENTLGRHWLQMHPDSRLGAELAYLVPLAGEVPPVPLKPVRELTLLDPACGTMHFGLVAFNLFAAMYREELEHAGEAGWPAQPSVQSADEIPAAILANNLFGIDIDLRAVQLAALSLYVRAKAL